MVSKISAGPSEKISPKGAFITFEGVDGCGKTTQAKLLAEKLRGAGLPVLETREPGGTEVGRSLRQVLLNPAHEEILPECELLLFLADRVQHLGELIVPALAKGQVVICDRFHDSTVAYQKFGRQLDFSGVEGVIARHIAPTSPVLTFWLEVELEAAQGRINERQMKQMRQAGEQAGGGGSKPLGWSGSAAEPAGDSRLENEALRFHLRVREGYAALLRENPRRIVKLDGALSIEELGGQVWRVVKERMDVL